MPADRWPAPSGSMIFFDVGGTLIEVAPSIGRIYADECGKRGAVVDASAIQAAFDNAWVTLSADLPLGADRYRFFPDGEDGWWRRICALAFDGCSVPEPLRPDALELREIFTLPASWHVYPEARAVLTALGDGGYRLGVISNWDSRLRALLAALDLDRYFEVVIFSAETGCEKPDASIFREALRRAATDPSRAVHIGDRLKEDYSAARACGLGALLVNRRVAPQAAQEDVVTDLTGAMRRITG